MRKLYVVDHAWPPTQADLAAAAAAGATETHCGLSPALQALGVSTFGYHVVGRETPAQRAARLQAATEARLLTMISGGVTYNGKRFQTRQDMEKSDRENIISIGSAAQIAILAGAQPNDLRWADADNDFGWIAEDNTRVMMDAQTMAAFYAYCQAAKSTWVYYARGLKDAINAAVATGSDAAKHAALDTLEAGALAAPWPVK